MSSWFWLGIIVSLISYHVGVLMVSQELGSPLPKHPAPPCRLQLTKRIKARHDPALCRPKRILIMAMFPEAVHAEQLSRAYRRVLQTPIAIATSQSSSRTKKKLNERKVVGSGWVKERRRQIPGCLQSRKATLSSGATARVRAPAEEARLGWRRYVKTSPLRHTSSLQSSSLNRC